VRVECTAKFCVWSKQHAVREVCEEAMLKHYRECHPTVAEEIRETLRREIAQTTVL